jgi:hypothetical protein
VLIYRGLRDDGSMQQLDHSMRQLDRVEDKLRALRKRTFYGLGHFSHVVGSILQVAIDRAVSKRIRLSIDWWKK